ncbi:ADP-dependent (S)-NAD(P)H-hydrate dehydratase [Alphaproteobacteria bacterium]
MSEMRDMLALLPTWDLESHKGQSGRVVIVGGSVQYYGAPIFVALGAEAAGADLIDVCLPREHIGTAKRWSLNFFLHPFADENLSCNDIENVCSVAKNADAVVIGNGVGTASETQKAVLAILDNIHDKPVVIDAEALIPAILDVYKKDRHCWVLTPHKGEFMKLFNLSPTTQNVNNTANKFHFTICLKGIADYITSGKEFYENHTGIPQMRVGGTGDVLAGIMACYLAQNLPPFVAAKLSAYFFGKCGEALAKKAHSFSAYQLLKFYPRFLRGLLKLAK